MDTVSNKYDKSGYFNMVKSKYILKKLFDNLPRNKFLNILRYNKNLKNILNIGVNDYLDYLKIEIELIPFKNKCGPFFNEINKRSLYHIYFNDNDKDEIKINYHKY